MADILKIFTNPTVFYRSFETSDRLKRGVAILFLTILTSIILSLLYFRWKVSYEILLPNPIPLEMPSLQLDYLIMSNLTSIFITAVILLGIGRLVARLTKAKHVGLKNFISAIFHAFLLLAVINIASAPAIIISPNETIYVVGAEMEDVVFFNVTVEGVVRPSGEQVRLSSDVLTVSHIDVRRVGADGSQVASAYVNSQQLAEVLKSTTTLLRFSGVAGRGVEIEEMEVTNVGFGDYVSRRTILGEVLVVGENPFIYSISGINIFRNIIWRILLAVSMAWSLRVLHNISRKVTITTMVVTYLILANLVPSPF